MTAPTGSAAPPPRRWTSGARGTAIYAGLTACWGVLGLLLPGSPFLLVGLVLAALGILVVLYRFLARLPALRPLFVSRTVWVSRAGWIYVGLTVVMGFAALNTGANLLYLVFAMLLAMLLVAGLCSEQTLRGLRVEPGPVAPVPAGAEAALPVRLANRKWLLASYAVRLDWRCPPGLEPVGGGFAAEVRPRSAVDCRLRIRCRRRGVYALDGLRVATGFPFGFVEHAWWHPARQTLVVWPRVGALRRHPGGGPAPRQAAPAHAGHALGEEEFHTLRDYRPGDNPRQIHWRSSARAQRLLLREQRDPRRPPVVVCVGGSGAPEALDAAADCAATLVHALAAEGRPVTLALGGTPPVVREVRAPRDGDAIRDTLARWTGGPAAGAAAALRPRAWRGAVVIVVSDDPADAGAAVAVATRHRAATVETWPPADAARAGWVDFGSDAWLPSSGAPAAAASTT